MIKKSKPQSEAPAQGEGQPTTYRDNAEINAKIDDYIANNPKRNRSSLEPVLNFRRTNYSIQA